ncbi:MAG TPA: RluA family pseudouridine synthase [Chitinophagales bacterium]
MSREEEDEVSAFSSDESASDDLYTQMNLVVDKGQEQQRIDKYLASRLPSNISRTRIQNAAEAGSVQVNGKAVKSNYRIRPEDNILLLIPKPEESFSLEPENIPLEVLYEDDDVLVINKQPGLVVHPGIGNHRGTLINALIYHFNQLPRRDTLRPGLVHRLDKDTSGIMVVAKTEYALSHLAKQFFDRTTQRKYLALVWGNMEENEGTITGNIGRHSSDRLQFEVFPDGDFGRHAVTHYKVVERFHYVTLVECKLETGRTHQIRVHMKHIGHTLFNDWRYGGDRILKGTIYSKYKQFIDNCFDIFPRQALHAASLGFTHPVTGKFLYFENELPQNFQDLLEKWRRYWQHLQQNNGDLLD